jgi:hypothetical protein
MDRDTPRAYSLPRDVQERLDTALGRFRNREAARTLAVFLARYWSAPGRLVQAFHIDRRALAEHAELGLTEKRIRGAIRTLEAIGFLDRAIAAGSLFKATPDGLRKKPIKFHFGAEYGLLFDRANRRVAARRERVSVAARSQVLVNGPRASVGSVAAEKATGPKNRNPLVEAVHLGPVAKTSGLPPKAFEPDPRLEAALARLEEGFRQSRSG